MRKVRIKIFFMNKKFVVTILILFLFVGNIYAQIDCDPFNPFVGDCEPEDVPIDSGVIFLMVAGILLGLRALKKDNNLKEA